MELLLDVGNTNLRWAQHRHGFLSEIHQVTHYRGLPIDLHAAWEQLEPPQRVLISNVAGPTLGEALVRACRSYWGLTAELVHTQVESHGVRTAYVRPENLGVDRWLALIGAHGAFPGSSLIIDAGTAVTFDVLLPDGRHLGGLILPGIEMMRDSLLSGTHIARVEADPSAAPWAVDTAPAVAAGSIQAVGALVDRLHQRLMAHQASKQTQILLTGGDAERIHPIIDAEVTLVPDLVLQGLARLV